LLEEKSCVTPISFQALDFRRAFPQDLSGVLFSGAAAPRCAADDGSKTNTFLEKVDPV
jgi:hypothetical protein